MQAPPDACKALYAAHNGMRLAWVSNGPGVFAIVQLMSPRSTGTPGNPKIPNDFWYGDENGRIDRGRLFNKTGGLKPDWNVDTEVPVIVAVLNGAVQYEDETPVVVKDLFTGRFIEAIRYWLIPIKERERASKEKLNIETMDHHVESTEMLHDVLKWEMNQTGAPSITTARKHLKEDGLAEKLEGQDNSRWIT